MQRYEILRWYYTVLIRSNPFSSATGWHPHNVSDNYARHTFSDYSSANNMPFDTTLHHSFSPFQAYPHDPQHQLQEEVDPRPGHPVNHDAPESHTTGCQWNTGYGLCGVTVDADGIGEHMSSYHFESPLSASTRLDCQWRGCQLRKPIRRDTIVRHIIEKHLGFRYRSKVAGFQYRSRKNVRPY